jgi:hypothetical protein
VYCADATQPSAIDFVDDDARRNWRDFITHVRENSNEVVTSQQLSAQYLPVYLREQVQSLENMWNDLLAEEGKVFGSSGRRAGSGRVGSGRIMSWRGGGV